MSLPARAAPTTIGVVNQAPAEEPPQAPRPAYDYEVAHTIWELERTVRRGRVSDDTRLALLNAHVQQLRMVEGRLGVAEAGRSFALLQDRIAPSVLLLPGEEQGCENLRSFANSLHRAGFSVLASSLAYRGLGQPGQSPSYWQTCLDEAENRYDMLNHYASRIAVVGVGLGAAIAMHLATRRRVNAVIALFPVLDAALGTGDRIRVALRNLMPRVFKKPTGWNMQRRLATDGVRKAMGQVTAPVLALAEDGASGRDGNRTLRLLQRLGEGSTLTLQQVPAGATSPDTLSSAAVDKLVTFLKQR